ncbi:MAG TPA: HypC/HybG/HupF family hydrogenase formation chaperone [Candidatus Portnoybacteria bacterium]|nr:HypC/HybG/HupF family hydrogenase formation chaperone [Candidatus Portnoybacteria bacterium]
MCLTIPKKVISAGKEAIVVKAGEKKEIVASLLPVKKGDWVLTQSQVIIKKITAKQAKEINNLII